MFDLGMFFNETKTTFSERSKTNNIKIIQKPLRALMEKFASYFDVT